VSGNEQAQRAWANAEVHLAEAEAIDPSKSPAALVHTSYYAMFHAARACLLKEKGTAPKKHDSVIREFGRLASMGDERLRQCGRDLNAAYDARIKADYSDVPGTTADAARAALRKASAFLEHCAAAFGFDRSRAD